VERCNAGDSGSDDLIKIIDQLIETIEATQKPVPMVTALINVTMYRGSIDKFRALIGSTGYVGYERRSSIK